MGQTALARLAPQQHLFAIGKEPHLQRVAGPTLGAVGPEHLAVAKGVKGVGVKRHPNELTVVVSTDDEPHLAGDHLAGHGDWSVADHFVVHDCYLKEETTVRSSIHW